MDYSQIYLGKPLANLEYADIERYFSTDQPESDQIEFKSYPPQGQGSIDDSLKGVIQSATAFLNSSGGLIIWGAPIGKAIGGKKEKVFVGDLTKVPLTVEKDALISKISDKIIPLPIGIRVKLIIHNDSQVAIFEVDESPYAPHQTENRYYMRIDGQSKPAPHHYIEALFKKISFPRLEAYIEPGGTRRHNGGIVTNIKFLFFNFSPFLNEEKFYYRISMTSGTFLQAKPITIGGLPALGPTPELMGYRSKGKEYRSQDPNISLSYGEPYSFSQDIFFESYELYKRGRKEKVFVSFGGKSAPLKLCQYMIDYKDIDNGVVEFTIDFQNQLAVDKQKEIGLDESVILKNFGVLT